jgi:hypothetical protein
MYLSTLVIKSTEVESDITILTPAKAHSSAYSKEISDIIYYALMSGVDFVKVEKVDSIEKLDKYDFEIWRALSTDINNVKLVDRMITIEESDNG